MTCQCSFFSAELNTPINNNTSTHELSCVQLCPHLEKLSHTYCDCSTHYLTSSYGCMGAKEVRNMITLFHNLLPATPLKKQFMDSRPLMCHMAVLHNIT